MIEVYKFGGASVKDAGAVRNVGEILRTHAGNKTIVVVSAMGKTTNQLEDLLQTWFEGREGVAEKLQAIRDYHLATVQALFPDTGHPVYEQVNNVFVEIQWTVEEVPELPYDQHYDQVVSLGEVLSSLIIAAWLKEQQLDCVWLDARGLLRTDNTYRDGKIDYETSAALVSAELLPRLERHAMVLTQGFIAGTSENYTTTLGREGSDYSAALFAYFSGASRVTIWKDVPGVLNADPKFFKNTRKIDELSYHEAIELSYYGASVIHPKTIKPLQNKNIPLYVRSFLKPAEPGTVIRDGEKKSGETSYIFKDNQLLVSIQPKDFSFIAEDNLSQIFSLLSRFGVRVNTMQNSAISFSLCIDDDTRKTEALLEELKSRYNVLYNRGVHLMTIRNYDQQILSQLTEGRDILLEQRSRTMCQLVMR